MTFAVELVANTHDVIQEYGTDLLYNMGATELLPTEVVKHLILEAHKYSGAELCDEFSIALNEEEKTDCLVEELIEFLDESEDYSDDELRVLAQDEHISQHMPNYLLDKFE